MDGSGRGGLVGQPVYCISNLVEVREGEAEGGWRLDGGERGPQRPGAVAVGSLRAGDAGLGLVS